MPESSPPLPTPDGALPRATLCRHFTGYRPCMPYETCEGCERFEPVGTSILLVNLDAMGDVLMTTAALPAIRRRWPGSSVTWVTLPQCQPLLANNPLIWRVMPYTWETTNILREMSFDVVINVDKSQRSAAMAMSAEAPLKLGFRMNGHGAIEPFNPECDYHWRLGTDDELKFRRNDQYGTRILAESLGLEWKRDEYVLELTDEERSFVARYRKEAGLDGRYVVGFNTGCSDLYPNKKMSVEQLAQLAAKIAGRTGGAAILLLGGKAETERNAEITRRARALGVDVVETPTTEGLRRGILYIAACDAVVTGDTSAMHIAIALKKWTVAHFGLSCAVEIDLYERGRKLVSGLECSPCWRKTCKWETVRCIEELDLDEIAAAVEAGAPLAG